MELLKDFGKSKHISFDDLESLIDCSCITAFVYDDGTQIQCTTGGIDDNAMLPFREHEITITNIQS